MCRGVGRSQILVGQNTKILKYWLGRKESLLLCMMNILCGDTMSALMLWVQFSKLPREWLLWVSAAILFFSFCQPAHDLKKVEGKTSSGETKFIKMMPRQMGKVKWCHFEIQRITVNVPQFQGKSKSKVSVWWFNGISPSVPSGLICGQTSSCHLYPPWPNSKSYYKNR